MAKITVSGYVGSIEISTYGEHDLLKFTVHEHHRYSPEKGSYIEKGKSIHYCNIWEDKIQQVKRLIATGAGVLVSGEQETTFSAECGENGSPKKRYTSIRVEEMGFTPHKIETIVFLPKK